MNKITNPQKLTKIRQVAPELYDLVNGLSNWTPAAVTEDPQHFVETILPDFWAKFAKLQAVVEAK